MLFPEIKRKAVHLVMGCFCLTLPWIFEHPWQADLLAIIAIIVLLLIRILKPQFGNVLHSVDRFSFGEILFPVGVTLVFRLADGDLSLYLPAIATLTFADAAGALIGKRFGRLSYRTNAGQKSVEGSTAVFLVSFLIVFFSGVSEDPLTNFLISVMAALVATMAEGILGAGIDNLILPLAMAALLIFLRELTWPELLLRITLVFAVALFLFVIRRLTSLNGGGLLSVTVFAYLGFALGGLPFLYAPALLFGFHLLTSYRFPSLDCLEHSATCVSAVTLPALIWIITKENSSLPEATCFHGYTLGFMAQTALIHSATREHLEKPTSMLLGGAKVSVIALTTLHWWPVWIAAMILTATMPFTRSCNRPEQAVFSYLFSLFALLV
jgi:phytol kinase